MPRLPLPRCLVAVADPEFASALSGIISRHGFEVTISGDPFASLRALRTEAFDLVLYDVSSESLDHDLVLDTLQRELPGVLDRTVLVTTRAFDSSRLPSGVPVIGPNDLRPLMDYLTRE